jgi:hypothetical protein
VSARCKEAEVGTTMERSERWGWNSMAAWFGCGQEGFGVGGVVGEESEALVPFIGRRRRGAAEGGGERPTVMGIKASSYCTGFEKGNRGGSAV